ncbi:MAG: cytochrome c oxidase assembly factor 5-like protein [Benniella sp.]|nr:MAG: cytochrome c oxidase assembly factor 5-like protein [Benniella sp.]
MPSSCKELRAELVDCILKSDCILVDGLTPKECLRSDNDHRVPPECMAIKRSFFECRRGLLDMRTRFRGNKS